MKSANRMRALLLVCCLPATANANAEVTEALRYGHYEARGLPGRSLAQILNDSSPYRPSGQVFHSNTSWNVDWKFQTSSRHDGKCKVIGVATHLSGQIDLPRLIGADAGVQKRFASYLPALRAHELGHYAIGRQAALAVDEQLRALPEMPSCKALESRARDLGARVLMKFEAKGNQYDLDTGHGRTQGAWLGD